VNHGRPRRCERRPQPTARVWMKRFKAPQTPSLSGLMAVRCARRRRGLNERGFTLISDQRPMERPPAAQRELQMQAPARCNVTSHGNSDGLAPSICSEQEGIDAEPCQGGFEA